MKNLLKKQLLKLERLLLTEEHRGPVKGFADLQVHSQALMDIAKEVSRAEKMLVTLRRQHLADLGQQLASYRNRYKNLQLPSQQEIVWARNLLQFPNLLILSIDVGNFDGNIEIVRLLAIDASEQIYLDRFIDPGEPLLQDAELPMGISLRDLRGAPPLVEVWNELLTAFAGKYVIASDLDDIKEMFNMIASNEGLEPAVFFGESLMPWAMDYFHIGWFTLQRLCHLIGHPLPEPARQTTKDRTIGILRVLQTMAQGTVIRPKDWQTDGDEIIEREFDEDDLDGYSLWDEENLL